MPQKKVRNRTIEIIYTFFLGIIIAVFVGLGIAAFYPEPKYPEMPATLKVYSIPVNAPEETKVSKDLLKKQEEYDKKVQAYQNNLSIYNRNVSIIALIASVVTLALSLIFLQRLLIIADGVLLGGVITLLYSVVRVFGSGDDKIRFLVVAIGLVVALVLGYTKFIKADTSE